MTTMSMDGSQQARWDGLADIVDGAARIGRIGRWHFDFQSGAMRCDNNWHAVMGQADGTPMETLADFRRIIHPDDRDRVTNIAETLENLVSQGQDYGVLFRILLPDETVRWIRSLGALQIDTGGRAPHGAAGFVIDVTDDMAMQAARDAMLAELRAVNGALEARQTQMAQWSFHDDLTGLANRACFDRDLDRACATAVRQRERLSIAIVALDHFSALRQAMGADACDAVLRTVAAAVASAARRPHDLAARYDDARLALLLPACADPRPILDDLRAAVKAMAMPHGASPRQPHVTLSIGAVSSCSVDVVAQLLDQCELALFTAGQVGGDTVVIVPDR